MKKTSIDMAERNGGLLRRVLDSAECCSERAIFSGSVQVNTPSSRSSAWLSRVTLPDQRVLEGVFGLLAIY